MKRITGVIMLLALTAFGARAQEPETFTLSQASAGARVYQQHCMYCHGEVLGGRNGVPALIGSAFRKQFSSAKTIYDFSSSTMPASDPGALTKQQYLDVTAFLLWKNGRQPGAKPLTLSAIGELQHR